MLTGLVAFWPASFAGHRWLAEVLVQGGELGRALEVLWQAEALSPGQPRVQELIKSVNASLSPQQPLTDDETARWTIDNPEERPQTWEGPALASPLDWWEGEPGRRGPPWWSRLAALGRTLRPRLTDPRWRLGVAAAATFGFVVAAVPIVTRLARSPGPASEAPPLPEAPPMPEGAVPSAPEAPSAITAGTAGELLKIVEAGQALLAGEPGEAATTPLLASALLASEYGRPVDPAVDAAAARLSSQALPEARKAELTAARMLLALAAGDLGAAEARAGEVPGLAPGAGPLGLAQARLLQRRGDAAGALGRLGPEPGKSAFLLVPVLAAELHLDCGEPEVAIRGLRDVLARAPLYPRAVALLGEARYLMAGALEAGEVRALTTACADEGARRRRPRWPPRARSTAAWPRASAASARRRAAGRSRPRGWRPRIRGCWRSRRSCSTTSARPIRRRAWREAAARLTDPRFAPVAWAAAGVRLSRGRASAVPAGSPFGPEARVIAVRAAFAEEPPARAAAVFSRFDPKLGRGDQDLRWFAQGVRASADPKSAVKFASSLRAGSAPGPVGAYVAGALAARAGRRHLAKLWLEQALEGHGDVCRAVALYAGVLSSLGKDPRKDARLHAIAAKQTCN